MTVAKTHTENFGRGQIGKDSKERFKDSTGASKFGSSQRSVYMCIWLSLRAQKLSPSKFKYIRNMQQTEVWEGAVERRDRIFTYKTGRERISVLPKHTKRILPAGTPTHKAHSPSWNSNAYYICKNMLLFAIYFSRT